MRTIKKYIELFYSVVTIRPLNQSKPPSNPTPEIDYRLLTENELVEFCKDPELEMTPSEVHELVSLGHLCVGGIKNGALVTYVWRSYGPTKHTQKIWIDFSSHCRYGFKSFTKEEFRGHRLNSYLVVMTDEVTRRGKSHSVGFIETHNYPSRHAAAFHGNEEVGYAGYIKFFGKYFTFHSSGAKRSGFRFFLKNSNVD